MELKDLSELIVDCPHTTAEDEGVGIPLIRTPNIGRGYFILKGVHRVSDKVYQERIKRAEPTEGDIVLAREAPAGNCAIIKKGYRLCLGQRTVLIRPNTKIVDSRYLCYYLLAPEQQHRLLACAEGSTVAHVNMTDIRGLDIGQIHPIPIQRRISFILGTLDDMIELNQKMNANLEAQAQALFKSWFVDFEPFGGKMPKGWRLVELEQLAVRVASGGTPKSLNSSFYDGPIRWFSTKELNDRFLIDSEKHISSEALDSCSAKVFPKNSLLMAIYASPTVGRLGILDEESTFNQAAVGIIARKNVGYPYLYLTLKNERERLNNLASGAAQQNLNVRIVKKYKVLLPDDAVLERFTNIVLPLFDCIRLNGRESRKLAELRDALLPKLMSGELEVAI